VSRTSGELVIVPERRRRQVITLELLTALFVVFAVESVIVRSWFFAVMFALIAVGSTLRFVDARRWELVVQPDAVERRGLWAKRLPRPVELVDTTHTARRPRVLSAPMLAIRTRGTMSPVINIEWRRLTEAEDHLLRVTLRDG
jgi:hypothetical protein